MTSSPTPELDNLITSAAAGERSVGAGVATCGSPGTAAAACGGDGACAVHESIGKAIIEIRPTHFVVFIIMSLFFQYPFRPYHESFIQAPGKPVGVTCD